MSGSIGIFKGWADKIDLMASAVRVQVRLLFEQGVRSQTNMEPDYRAICWLVEQQYLTPTQAAGLVDGLAKEVMEGFLMVKAGIYDVADRSSLEAYPEFCRMDLRSLVEFCQSQLRQRQPVSTMPVNAISSAPSASPMSGSSSLNLSSRTGQPVVPAMVGRSAGQTSVTPPPPAARSQVQVAKDHYLIVCIDDSPTVLQAIHSFLDDTSFTVVMINDPVKALM